MHASSLLLSVVAMTGLSVSVSGVAAQTSSSSVSSAVVSGSQSSSAASASASMAPVSTTMIPSNISTSCSAFLNTLNTDSQFTSCMQPLLTLTNAYSPSNSSAADGSTASAAEISATLVSLCSSSSGCSNSLIRSYLTQFSTQCSTELTSSTAYNAQVRELYDYLYVLNPFRGAVCAKDTNTQTYCVLQIANAALAGANTNATTSSSSSNNATAAATNGTSVNSTASAANTTSFISLKNLASYSELAQEIIGPVAQAAANLVIYGKSPLARRDSQTATSAIDESLVMPNTTTYRQTSLPFLFLQPNMSSTLLCSSCTKTVLAAYASWEAQIPYALGLASSPILGAQNTLWAGIQSTCGTNFTNAIEALAGILAANGSVVASTSGASARVGDVFSASAVTLLIGVLGAAFMTVF